MVAVNSLCTDSACDEPCNGTRDKLVKSYFMNPDKLWDGGR